MARDDEVTALKIESLKLVVQAEGLLGRLQDHQRNLEMFLGERREQQSHRTYPGDRDA